MNFLISLYCNMSSIGTEIFIVRMTGSESDLSNHANETNQILFPLYSEYLDSQVQTITRDGADIDLAVRKFIDLTTRMVRDHYNILYEGRTERQRDGLTNEFNVPRFCERWGTISTLTCIGWTWCKNHKNSTQSINSAADIAQCYWRTDIEVF